MTKEQAIKEMKKGVKITHRYFSGDEWMTMENGKVVLEDGVRCPPNEFWNYRKEQCWDDGYEIFLP